MRDTTQLLQNFVSRLHGYIKDWPVDPDVLDGSTDWFNTMALELFSIQFDRNRPYRKWCEKFDQTPEKTRMWHDIPAVPIRAFKEFRLTCLDESEVAHFFVSSGTTGKARSHHYHSNKSLALYQSSLVSGFENLFLHASLKNWNGIFVSMIPEASLAPNSSLAHMVQTLVGATLSPHNEKIKYISDVSHEGYWRISEDKINTLIESCAAIQQPVIFMGTAFSYVHLTDYLHERKTKINLPEGSLVMETGGYKGQSREVSRNELHEMISDSLNVEGHQIITEYGMSELSSQAYRIPGSPPNPYVCPPWMRVRIINPESGKLSSLGEPGVIQVFDLANTWSVFAIETEDIGAQWHGGFEVIGRSHLSEPKGCSLSETGLSFSKDP